MRTVTIREVNITNCYDPEHPYGFEPDVEGPAYPQHVADAVDKVLHDDVDYAKCPKCKASIGFNSFCREDSYGREVEGIDFRTFWVADDGDKAWVLCEDCTSVFEAEL